MDPTPTPTNNDGLFGQSSSRDANQVSVVTTLCGTESCDPNSWNNRFLDRTSRSSDDEGISDLGPLYRPQTTTEEYIDEAIAHDRHTNQYALPIAVAIPIAAVIAFIVLFSLYRRKRRERQKQIDEGERGPYGQLDSGEPSPATSETFEYNQQPIARRLNSHVTASSNRTSVFTAATPPLPYRRSTNLRYMDVRPQSVDVPVRVAEPESPLQPPPTIQPEVQRIRANTFSDIPPDDLPPYVDPIEEAMADTDRPTSLHLARQSQETLHGPPPYDTITIPDRVQL
ncbi:hypothetical protein IW139_003161 [Coemansia sp. RSA 353]|nr:hypothetical protein GGH17_003340 [Coemansia sp. RSA 788]KAJ2153129.1 hypothetical protein J3F82_002197 [Coemansia sp. RSA 637]KAJ2181436.1 hypothetical protein EV181_005216 [Coemansia sp. RSA 532]KAJ2274887.1 hypothetical protein J3F81_002057 [Coemansia sp. RSA 371]KAJ2280471.1 hypothetical protein GGH14_002349 [Coemansia sp. RSA 370]KAJ2296810.1 hypothetical protein IW139_003161 [Coemansia sp. RSA 353]KAJ2548613.1 hypothetical protein IWW35_004110 [Coemansia sp. RSA 1878]